MKREIAEEAEASRIRRETLRKEDMEKVRVDKLKVEAEKIEEEIRQLEEDEKRRAAELLEKKSIEEAAAAEAAEADAIAAELAEADAIAAELVEAAKATVSGSQVYRGSVVEQIGQRILQRRQRHHSISHLGRLQQNLMSVATKEEHRPEPLRAASQTMRDQLGYPLKPMLQTKEIQKTPTRLQQPQPGD